MSVVLDRPPRTEDELWHLVRALWGHTIPRTPVCPDHTPPFTAFATGYFAREPQTLIHGSRGLAGKSRLLSILGLTRAAVEGSDVNIVGGSLNQSQNIHETMRDAWDWKNAPSYLIKDAGVTIIRLHNGAKIRPLTASQKTVRGPHPPFLLLDEIDEMDQDILDAALGQPMPQKNYAGKIIQPQTTMSSTWQYPDKTFAEMYRRFQENDLPIYQWCYRETSNPVDGWLSPDFVEQKKREIPAEMWRVEYELGEPSIGTRAFDFEMIEKTFSEDVPEPVKVQKDFEQYRLREYRTDREYIIAADWAQSMDFTVITVWDCTELPIHLAYYMRLRRRPYPVMIEYYNKLMTKYHAEGIHDATGLGNVVADYLNTRVRNFKMVGEQRDSMLTEYVAAVENDKVRAARIPSIYKEHLYCSVDDMYSRSKEFHLPDSVCSAALAWKLVMQRPVAVGPIPVAAGDEANWMRRQIEHNTQPDRKREWMQGEVRRIDQEDEFSLMV